MTKFYLFLCSVLFSTSLVLAEVARDPESVTPLLVGQEIPEVSLRNKDGKKLELRTLVSKKPSIVVFYRGGWCPYCNLQLQALAQMESKLLKLGYQIIALSPDRPEKVAESLAKHDVSYMILSDSSADAAQAFGLAFKVDGKTVKKYKKDYNIDLEADSGETHHLLPVPGVFIVSQDAVIQFTYVNPNYKVRLNPELLLAAAEAYKYGSTPLNLGKKK